MLFLNEDLSRSHCPRGLWRESAATCLLGLCVRTLTLILVLTLTMHGPMNVKKMNDHSCENI
jgi:hypothetical protein